jgi:hypothetical protein
MPVATNMACPICGGLALRLGLECRGVTSHTVVLHQAGSAGLTTDHMPNLMAALSGAGRALR